MTAPHSKRSKWRSGYGVYVISTALVLAGGVQLARAAQNRRLPPPKPIQQAIGQLADSVVSNRSSADDNTRLLGRSHVVYLFAQTCRYCESQKAHMQEILTALGPNVVATATDESDATALAYWPAAPGALPIPDRIDVGAMTKLGLPGVPALLFVGPDGRVVSAYVGVATAWDLRRFRSELARAGSPSGH